MLFTPTIPGKAIYWETLRLLRNAKMLILRLPMVSNKSAKYSILVLSFYNPENELQDSNNAILKAQCQYNS